MTNETSPIATCLAEMITAKQLQFIDELAREKQIDAEKLCESLFRCSVYELSIKAANDLIQKLKDVQ